MTECKRCGIGESVRGEDCLECQLVLAKNRILEIEQKCVVETFTLAADLRTARAQVATLAEALRFVAHGENYACRAFEPCPACYARAALKAAGIEP